jgi:hypothetical protein
MILPCHNLHVLRSRLGRVLVAICLLGWLAPAGASFAVVIHLATDADHHGDDARQLALDATHGHSHDVRTTEHGHPAVRAASVVANPPVLAVLAQNSLRSPILDSSDGYGARPQPTESPPLSLRSRALRL